MASNAAGSSRPGRPRRRPFAAHAARAVRLRVQNARTATLHLAWRLQGEHEVSAYLAVAVPAQYRWFVLNYATIADVLRRLDAALVDPSAPAEGAGDA